MQLKTAKIEVIAGSLSAKALEIQTSAIVLVPTKDLVLKTLPHGADIAKRMERATYKVGAANPFVTDLPNKPGTRLSIAGIKPDIAAFDLLTLARKLVAAHTESRPTRIAIACHGLDAELAARAYEAVVAAALAAGAEMPTYKKETDRPPTPTLTVYAGSLSLDFTRTVATARGNALARYLTALPPNELTPGNYRNRVLRLAREHKWKTRFLDTKALQKLGAGAFLAVAQGSPEADAGILHLQYTPRASKRPSLALVGKGICFDTGGTNLKNAKYMHGMHEDMQGSAVALGTLLALTELKVDFPVDCWLALAQNHIGPKSYRQNEVVKAANGMSIEIMHTDAEGRMVLADTLYLASQRKPKLLIDYATLTGACMGALSTRMSGALTNRPAFASKLIEAGEASGERVWPFPLPADYGEALKSDIADIKQCILENDADHILAALFLQKFLANDPDWIHIDLAAGNHKGGLAHIPTDITGFGVRFTLTLLEQNAWFARP